MNATRHEQATRTPAVVLGDLTLVRPFDEAGIPVVVAGPDTSAPVMHSRLPREVVEIDDLRLEPERTLDELLRLARAIRDDHGQKPLLVYGSDTTLDFVYRHREALGAHYALLLNRPEVAEALLYKDAFAEYADRCDLPVPRTAGVGSPQTRLDDLAEPLIVKPRHKHGADGAWRSRFFGAAKARIFATRQDLLAEAGYVDYADELLVQEYIDGAITDLVSFHGFSNERAEPLATFCGRKLRTFPAVGGESALIELVDEPEIEGVGAEVAAKLGLVGVYKIDLIRDPRDDRLLVMEANARFNLWHQLGAVHQVNLPAVAHEYLVEGSEPEPQAMGRRPQVRWADVYRNMQAMRHGEVAPSTLIRSLLRGPNVYETFAWSDPEPALWWLGEMIRDRFVGER